MFKKSKCKSLWLSVFTFCFFPLLSHSANDYVVAPVGGDITGVALSAKLEQGDVSLQSSSGSATGLGNVIINDVVSWSANNTLTLTASNTIEINTKITLTGNTAGLVISPNTKNGSEQPSGSGTYKIPANVTISGSNPNLTINGSSYTVINSLGAAQDASTPPAVATLQSLAAKANLGKKYALGGNIDASATSTWNNGAGFTPIGEFSQILSFSGVFEGLGNTIKDLSIESPKQWGGPGVVALFGATTQASEIKNVVLANCNIVGGSYSRGNSVAGLVASHYGKIINSHVIGDVKSTNADTTDFGIGGLVGENHGSIESSNFVGTTSVGISAKYIGGLVGSNSGSIQSSYATARVAVKANAQVLWMGGLVGSNSGTISKSYVTGSLSGTAESAISVGGLVGMNCGSSSYMAGCGNSQTGIIKVTYAAVSTNIPNTGGLIGQNVGNANTNYWNNELSNVGVVKNSGTITGTRGLPEIEMRFPKSYVGFDFTKPEWVIINSDGGTTAVGQSNGATYPMLAGEYSTTIVTTHQLQLMAMNPAASYTVNTNINASGTSGQGDVWGSDGFIPIGSFSTPFSGEFNGRNHSISNLSVHSSKLNRTGLFGVSSEGSSIEDTRLVDANIVARSGGSVGSLIGVNNGAVSSCTSSGSVKGTRGGFIGGLIGSNNGDVNTSQSSSSVSGTGGFKGGLVGVNTKTISNSSATGKVTGRGGFSGELTGLNEGTIN